MHQLQVQEHSADKCRQRQREYTRQRACASRTVLNVLSDRDPSEGGQHLAEVRRAQASDLQH